MKRLSYVLLLICLAQAGAALACSPSMAATENTGGDTPADEAMCSPGGNADLAAHVSAQAPPQTSSPTQATPPPYAAKLRADADAVLKGPDFHQMESGTVPMPRPWLKKWLQREGKKKTEQPVSAPDFSGLAQILKIVVILVLALLLGWLLWRGYQWLAPQLASRKALQRQGRVREAESKPLQNRSELPEGISAHAAQAWQNGETTLALSLLYRGAVAALASRYQLSLPHGATEGDYQRLLRRRGKAELSRGFNTITQAWMAQAYANRRPDDFSSLLQTYRQHFENSGSAS